MAAERTIGGRLVGGLLAIALVAGIASAIALSANRELAAALEQVARTAETGRRLTRVASLYREYYMHQAHLALGMQMSEHLTMVETAHGDLAAALEALASGGVPDGVDVAALRQSLDALDALFRDRFLPALRAGTRDEAVGIHFEAAHSVQSVLDQLTAAEAGGAAAIERARSRAAAAAQTANWRSVVVMAGALALAVAVAWWMSRGITQPVARLEAAADALPHAPEGTRVPEDGPAEVVALGRTLNRVLGELQSTRRARAEAETMAVLGRVAAGIAHEINNPLGVILGNARLEERTAPEAVDEAQAIAREAQSCQGIVRALLDYARPGAPVDLTEVAELAVARADDDAVRLTVGSASSAKPAPPPIRGDAARLEQLIAHLVDNARAHGASVHVTLVAAEVDDRSGARVEVRDDGPGVPADDLERIFEPFYTTRADGTGLGLAIGRSVAAAHGGTLRAHPGPGGHFELWLPSDAEPGVI